MTQTTGKTWFIRGAIVAAVVAVAVILWSLLRPADLPEGIVSGNGRLEALEIDISAKTPGRIRDIVAEEGQLVKAGEVVAHMDVETLSAQLSEAKAQLAQALNAVQIAQTQVGQRQSERAAALATVRQREAELNAARKRLGRSETLAREGATPTQERDDNQAAVEGASATVEAARAQLASADANIAAARSQVIGARSNVDAARATIARIEADIRDSDLKAPRGGRIQYRVAQPGEVVAGGGRVMNLVDLTDVYMTFFLPETVAGRVRNYVFVTFRLHLSGDANMEAVRAKEAWFRDAIIRAAHRRSFAAPDSLVAVDANALALAMGRAARVLVGEGTIERVEIANQIPRRRTGLT